MLHTIFFIFICLVFVQQMKRLHRKELYCLYSKCGIKIAIKQLHVIKMHFYHIKKARINICLPLFGQVQ